jgi:predicted ATP-binding protein involved in virulence
MLTKAIIRNYKSLFDVEITFESRLTVIVGPNGCGKSSVLKVIEANLSGIQKGNPQVNDSQLEDHPDFDKWSNSMTPGEFRSYEAEDWVKENAAQKKAGVLAGTAR